MPTPEQKHKPHDRSPAPLADGQVVKATNYELADEEKPAIERFKRRWAARSAAPRVKVEQKDKSATFSLDHADQGVGYALLAEALGTPDFEFASSMLTQVATAVSRGGKVSEKDLNFVLTTIKDLKPKDQIEAMLAAQMGVIHLAVMAFAQRMANVGNNIPQQDSIVNNLTKLTRAFATQIETFKKYRTGEQKVTVQQVNVGEGGQAIVGNVTTQGARAPAQGARSAPALTHSGQAPMPLIGEAEREMVTQQKKHKNGRGSSA